MSQNESIKWIDGRMAQGAFIQWLVDEHPEALNIKSIHIISRYTLGYRKRYAYIEENKFNLSHNKKWREIKKLKDLGLLEYSKTRGYTMFKLVLPEWLENIVSWRNSGNIEEPKKEKEVELDQNMWVTTNDNIDIQAGEE